MYEDTRRYYALFMTNPFLFFSRIFLPFVLVPLFKRHQVGRTTGQGKCPYSSSWRRIKTGYFAGESLASSVNPYYRSITKLEPPSGASESVDRTPKIDFLCLGIHLVIQNFVSFTLFFVISKHRC
ncbi:hypothetical protein F4809DRAFT_118695 [Biscogniauxia mediterranea]|nr:hypothetical protein F4809DRAFT_118695 [Biscogniauxia mediterranea]